jgi:hypothetical protein
MDETTCTHCRGYGCTECLAALPEGKTCADCIHVRRCVAMFGGDPGNTSCDWIPSRYLAAGDRERV